MLFSIATSVAVIHMCIRIAAVMLGFLVFWAGCSGPKETIRKEPDRSVELAEVETFDAEPYRVYPMEEEAFDLEHRVPAALMNPSVGGDRPSEMPVMRSGYRIQIFSGEKKVNADQRYNDALVWWNQTYAKADTLQGVLSANLPIHLEYQPPYYKVRIGDFLTRRQAQKALSVVQQRFEAAWIVPDQVIVNDPLKD